AVAGATAAARGLSTNALAPARAAASAARWASVRAVYSIPRSMPSARKPSSTKSVKATITMTDPVSLSTIRIEARIIVPRSLAGGRAALLVAEWPLPLPLVRLPSREAGGLVARFDEQRCHDHEQLWAVLFRGPGSANVS